MNRFESVRCSLSTAAETSRQRASTMASATQANVASAAKLAMERVNVRTEGARDRAVDIAENAQSKATALAKDLPGTTARTARRGIDVAALSPREKMFFCRELVGLALCDGTLHPREISALYLLMTNFELTPAERAELRGLLAPAQHGQGVPEQRADSADGAAHLLDTVEEERREAVAVGLLRHMVDLSRADGDVNGAERERINAVAETAFPERGHDLVIAIEHMAVNEAKFLAGKISTSQFETTAKDLVAKAAAFGAPIAAISAAGSVGGLGAAGITSGLATLGIGGALGLSSMVTGIGAVVLLGVVVHQGARFALGTNERGREKKREHLVQQVLLNHQRSITDLTDDVGALARRMDEHLSRTEVNETRLAELRSELEAFQIALADLQSSRTIVEEQAA